MESVKGNCEHGEFDLTRGCPECIEKQREINSEDGIAEAVEAIQRPEINMANKKGTILDEFANWPEEARLPIKQRALVRVNPEIDEKVVALYNEGVKLLEYAKAREIKTNEDLPAPTNDLSIIAKTKKAIEAIRKEYINPIRQHLDQVNAVFKEFTAPLLEADQLNRSKMTEYRTEVARKIAEAKAIEQDKLDLAKREEALTGEHTVDLTPVEAPPEAQAKVHTDMGSAGVTVIGKWELVDITQVPPEYMMLDTVKVGKVVRASKGSIIIPGIWVYKGESIRVTTR